MTAVDPQQHTGSFHSKFPTTSELSEDGAILRHSIQQKTWQVDVPFCVTWKFTDSSSHTKWKQILRFQRSKAETFDINVHCLTCIKRAKKHSKQQQQKCQRKCCGYQLHVNFRCALSAIQLFAARKTTCISCWRLRLLSLGAVRHGFSSPEKDFWQSRFSGQLSPSFPCDVKKTTPTHPPHPRMHNTWLETFTRYSCWKFFFRMEQTKSTNEYKTHLYVYPAVLFSSKLCFSRSSSETRPNFAT